MEWDREHQQFTHAQLFDQSKWVQIQYVMILARNFTIFAIFFCVVLHPAHLRNIFVVVGFNLYSKRKRLIKITERWVNTHKTYWHRPRVAFKFFIAKYFHSTWLHALFIIDEMKWIKIKINVAEIRSIKKILWKWTFHDNFHVNWFQISWISKTFLTFLNVHIRFEKKNYVIARKYPEKFKQK